MKSKDLTSRDKINGEKGERRVGDNKGEEEEKPKHQGCACFPLAFVFAVKQTQQGVL